MNARLLEVALVFLRLGFTAFGGPAAHVALMRTELVERRRWISDEAFLDRYAATNFIPGPNSTELAIHLGHHRAGPAGLVVAGVCFIVPAALLTTVLAFVYVRYGHLPDAAALLYGTKPVIVAIVAQALLAFRDTAVKTTGLAALGVLAVAAGALGVPELVVLAAAGALCAFAGFLRNRDRGPAAPSLVLAVPALAGAAAPAVSTGGIFFAFLKIGSVLFGSGYVLLAFLRAELVEARGWLTEAQILDAVAVGQITPGPVFSTATFVGYLLGGGAGATAATVGIFLPAFVFVALSGPIVSRLRRTPAAGRALDGVNVASLALMLVVTFDLGRAALVDPWTIGIGAIAFIALFRFKVPGHLLVAAGAATGLALR